MAGKIFPYPPRHSMYWEEHQYTYDQAKALYEQGEMPLSRPNDLSANGGKAVAKPPERSMMWENEKLKQPPVEPQTPVKKRKEKTVTPCHLFPVRYALDENDENGKPKHGLPKGWRGRGYFSGQSVAPYQYTLRQLRDGWLYVYNETAKTLDEYALSGVALTRYEQENYDFKTLDPVEGPTERGTLGTSQPFLTYNSDTSIRIAWSKHRWSWPMFYLFATSPSVRFHARHIDCSRLTTHPGDHIVGIDQLDQVADIDAQAGEIERFTGLVHTKTPAETTVTVESPDTPEKIDVTLDLEVKPVAAATDITSSLPANESGYLVAIHDMFSDLCEMGIRFTAVVAEWQDWLEYEVLQNQLMEAVMQITATDIPEGMDIRYPYLLDEMPRSEQLVIYQEICELYEKRRQYEAAAMLGTNGGDARAYGLGIELQKAEAAFRKQRGNIAYRSFYKDWYNVRKNRRMIDRDKLIKDKIAYFEQEGTCYPLVETHRDATLAMLRQFGKDVYRKAFVDIFSPAGQNAMQALHGNLVTPLLYSRLTQAQNEWLENEYGSPSTIFPLYLTGYSCELYDAYDLYLKCRGDIALADNADTTEAVDSASASKDFTISYGAFLAFMNDPGVQSHAKLGGFATFLSTIHDSFTQTISAPLKAGATQSVSGIAHILASSLTFFGANPYAKKALDLGILAESFATSAEVHIKGAYQSQIQAWEQKLQQITKDLSQAEKVVQTRVNHDHRVFIRLSERALGKTVDQIAEETYQAGVRRNQLMAVRDAHLAQKPLYAQIEADYLKEEGTKTVKANIENASLKMGSVMVSSGVDLLVVLVNLRDLVSYTQSLKTNNVYTVSELSGITQRMMATSSSLVAVFQAPAWSAFNSAGKSFKHTYYDLKDIRFSGDTRISANQAKAGIRFANLTKVAASFGLISAVMEFVPSLFTLLKAKDELKVIHGAKTMALGGQAYISAYQLLQASRGAVAAAFAPWVLFASAGIGLSLMIINQLIDYFERNDFQKWLASGPWGTDQLPVWQPDGDNHYHRPKLTQALQALHQLYWSPVIHAMPNRRTEYRQTSTYPAATRRTEVMEGVWLNIELPRLVAGKLLGVMFVEPAEDAVSTVLEQKLGVWKKQDSDTEKSTTLTYQCYLPLQENQRNIDMVLAYCQHPNSDERDNDNLYYFSFSLTADNLVANALSHDEVKKKLGPMKNRFEPQVRIYIEG